MAQTLRTGVATIVFSTPSPADCDSDEDDADERDDFDVGASDRGQSNGDMSVQAISIFDRAGSGNVSEARMLNGGAGQASQALSNGLRAENDGGSSDKNSANDRGGDGGSSYDHSHSACDREQGDSVYGDLRQRAADSLDQQTAGTLNHQYGGRSSPHAIVGDGDASLSSDCESDGGGDSHDDDDTEQDADSCSALARRLERRGGGRRRTDSGANLLEDAGDGGGDSEATDLLVVTENHFANAEDYRGVADVERAIERAKLAVLALPVDSPQRRPLVDQLVALRLRRDELLDDTGSSTVATGSSTAAAAAAAGGGVGGSDAATAAKNVFGHALLKYQAFPALGGASERACEACRAIVWGVLQSWYGCSVCPVVCHERCLGTLRRPCGAFVPTSADSSGTIAPRPAPTTPHRSHASSVVSGGSSSSSSSISSSGSLPLAICPEVGLAAQGYRCYECRAPLAFGRQSAPSAAAAAAAAAAATTATSPGVTAAADLEPRQCDVTGRYYCSACHWGDVAVSPARVLHNWDFELRPVCRLTKHRLAAAWRRWLVRPRDVNPRLFSYVEELSVARRLREEILQMKAYFATCARARGDRLLLRLADRQHFVDGADAYTLRDLVDLAHDALLPELVAVHAAFTHHIKVDCETCRGKGFLCELCDNRRDVLFAFDGGLAAQCAVCGGVFHRVCFAKCDSPCPRCERRSRRAAAGTNGVGLPSVAVDSPMVAGAMASSR